MDTKLTLKLDEGVIEKAKLYARGKNTSLSNLIENYLQKLMDEKEPREEITPLVKSLSGIIDLPEDYDYKAENADRLITKYK